MWNKIKFIILFIVLFTFLFIVLFVVLFNGIFYPFLPDSFVKELSIIYPFNGSLFPPEIASPTFRWDDKTDANSWIVRFEFQDKNEPLEVQTVLMEWTPKRDMWESVKEKTLEKTAKVTILGFKKILGVKEFLSKKSISIKTSSDEVGAPIFYRDVPLPFRYAVDHKDEIKWRLGDISSDELPPVVLENLAVCGNCHSFSADGRVLGMDVDYANDKGSYIITKVSEDIILMTDKVITWTDYKKEDEELTFGLLSQISPDGKYAVSTVKDRSVFVPVSDLYYSQLFFPLKGILTYYNRETGSFHALPGADDKRFVQSNPTWSPDGEYIVFARNKADSLGGIGKKVVLSEEDCEEYLIGGKKFRYDLYRIPFNDGKGGEAEPLPGASNNGMSNYFAKYSPDGKWIVFCKANSYMLLQPDSKLYIMPAEGEDVREMRCNTNQMNSWHSWSPNGKWLVFSSKVFTPYTQLFLTHIDEEGNDSPPVLLSNFITPNRAANIPEFINIKPDGIKQMHESFLDYYSYAREGGDFMRSGKYEEAKKSFKKSIELYPDYALAHEGLGMILVSKGQIDRAIIELETALKLDPERAAAHLNLGIIHLNSKNHDKAQKSFETAIKLNPDIVEAHEGLGLILLSKGDFDKAQMRFESALAIDPERSSAHINLGEIYMNRKELDKAQMEIETALKLEPNFAGAHYRLGLIYIMKKEFDKAQMKFEDALKINPGFADAHYELGTIYMMKKEFDKAERAFRTIYQINPNNPNVCFMLGRVLSMNDRTIQEAISMYNKSLSLMPSNTQGHIELGNLYLIVGNRAQAIEEFKKALKLDPEQQDLREHIYKLKQQR